MNWFRNHMFLRRSTKDNRFEKKTKFPLIYHSTFKLTTHHFGDPGLCLESKSKNKRKYIKHLVNDVMFTIIQTMTKSGKKGSSPECEYT